MLRKTPLLLLGLLLLLLLGVTVRTDATYHSDSGNQTSSALTASTTLPGDVDCDQLLSTVDAIVVLRHAAGLVPDPACLSSGNVDCNEAVNVVDAVLILGVIAGSGSPTCSQPRPDPDPPAEPTPGEPSPTPAPPTPIPTPIPPTPPVSSVPKILFGLGPEADGGEASPLTKAAPVKMLTSWYNGPNDLNWMQNWGGYIDGLYAKGFAMHLIIWSDGPENGSPCGRQYPISEQINGDVARLAQVFGGDAGGPPLFVTLFSEFQTFPCQDNQWVGSEAYYTRLKTKIRELQAVIKQNAPNARVSFGWGGWQVEWDDPSKGAGLSLFPHFNDVMGQMDFQSFQAMDNSKNVESVRQMTTILGKFGPVMLAHYQPDNRNQATFDSDTTTMLSDSFLTEMVSKGLFAWSFMSDHNVKASQSTFDRIVAAIQRYGAAP